MVWNWVRETLAGISGSEISGASVAAQGGLGKSPDSSAAALEPPRRFRGAAGLGPRSEGTRGASSFSAAYKTLKVGCGCLNVVGKL